jgi:hypothetical protein
MHSGPRSVTDWYSDAIAALEDCHRQVEAMNAPVLQPDLLEAKRLARQLVELAEERATP